MPYVTAYVDGCSYNRKGNLKAEAGVVWLNNDPCPLQQLKIRPSIITICRNSCHPHHPTTGCIPQHQRTAADNLLTLQNADPSLRTMAAHISDPLTHPTSTSDLNMSSELRTLNSIKHMLNL